MKTECYKCQDKFETTSENVKMCPACNRAYRILKGLCKPDGWERKTADLNAYKKAYKEANPERFKEYNKKKKKRTPEQEREKYVRRMKRIHGDDWVPASERPSGRNEQKHTARRIYRDALKRGKIIRQPCFICGDETVDGHHPDYSRPLDVIWLCKEHHKEVHKS